MKQLWAILLIVLPFLCTGQGLHYSQVFNTPTMLSAANSGSSSSIGLIHRNQWRRPTDKEAYKSISLLGDFKLKGIGKYEFINQDWMGMGFTLNQDQAGYGGLTTTSGTFLVSYHYGEGFNGKHFFHRALHFSVGTGIGFYNKAIKDIQKLHFEDQWDGFEFDPGISSNEPFMENQQKISDFTYSILFGATASIQPAFPVRLDFSFGIETFPSPSFYNTPFLSDSRRTYFSASAHSQGFHAYYYLSQLNNASENILGLNYILNRKNNNFLIMLGGSLRNEADMIVQLGILSIKNRYRLTASYDMNKELPSNSTLKGRAGSIEVSFIKYFNLNLTPLGYGRQISGRGYKNRKQWEPPEFIIDFCRRMNKYKIGSIHVGIFAEAGKYQTKGLGLSEIFTDNAYYTLTVDRSRFLTQHISYGLTGGFQKFGESLSVPVTGTVKIWAYLPMCALYANLQGGYALGYYFPVMVDGMVGMHGYLIKPELGVQFEPAAKRTLSFALSFHQQHISTLVNEKAVQGDVEIFSLKIGYGFISSPTNRKPKHYRYKRLNN